MESTVNLTSLLVGLSLILVGLFLSDLKKLFTSNFSVMKKEQKRYKQNFSVDFDSKRKKISGTRLDTDHKGAVIIIAEWRLAPSGYV